MVGPAPSGAGWGGGRDHHNQTAAPICRPARTVGGNGFNLEHFDVAQNRGF
jgi:hypothetical protein